MSSQAWESLSPQQQRAEWDRWNAWQQQLPSGGRRAAPHPPAQPWSPPAGLQPYPIPPPQEAAPKANVAAGFGLCAGIIGLFVVPFVFGLIALVCGAGGLEHAKNNDGTGHGAPIGALVLGGINMALPR